MPIYTPHYSYDSMIARWEKCRDAFSGSEAVKRKKERYLPRIGADPNDGTYEKYITRALYYNATRRTVEGLSGAIFQKDLALQAPSDVVEQSNDVSLNNVSLQSFALLATQEVMVTGRYGVLIEHNEERPYWVPYEAEDIISWRTERVDGVETLTKLVLREYYDEEDPSDEYVLATKEQYRLLWLEDDDGPGARYAQMVFREHGGRGEYSPTQDEPSYPTRRKESLPFIPFAFCSPTGQSIHVNRPPLEDLIDLNISHYQTMADLEWGRHWTALPTPWVAGFIGGENAEIPIGSTKALRLEENGKAGMMEFGGQGLASLVTGEQDKRKMMATQGARLLEDQPRQPETFGAVGLRHAGEHASLRTIAGSIDATLTTLERWQSWWNSTADDPSDEDVVVDLNKDFFRVRASPQEVEKAMMLVQSELWSYPTFWNFLMEGEWAPPGVTAEDELAAIRRGAPEPGLRIPEEELA